MGKKSKRSKVTMKPPVRGGNNDGDPPRLQQPWSILNSAYMMPYMPVGLSRDLEEFGLNHGYIPFGLGTIPCARRSPTPTSSEAPTTSSKASTLSTNPTMPNSTKPTTTKPTTEESTSDELTPKAPTSKDA
jgi:hypothetical protein